MASLFQQKMERWVDSEIIFSLECSWDFNECSGVGRLKALPRSSRRWRGRCLLWAKITLLKLECCEISMYAAERMGLKHDHSIPALEYTTDRYPQGLFQLCSFQAINDII